MSAESGSVVPIDFIYHGKSHTRSFPSDATISDLSFEISESLHVPLSNQKLMISKVGLLKPPFKDPALLLSSIADKKITLMGSTTDEVSAMSIASDEATRRVYLRSNPLQKVKAYKVHDWIKDKEQSQYTFITLRPLSNLPNPSRSLQLLQRLKDDAGIKSAMQKHKFTVSLLTEMNPIDHTQSNQEGITRTLGLNRNKGEVIELRLRTDAYDGYRDYKTIRKALCHELAHNVHGPHDRKFWDLCNQIEKEVEGADWRSGGRTIGGVNSRECRDEIDDQEHWTGGEYVLGAGSSNRTKQPLTSDLSRREILAKAAETRMKQTENRHSDEPHDTS